MYFQQQTLLRIIEKAMTVKHEDIRRVLILQEQKSFYIGDSCVWFSKLKHLRSFFNDAAMDLAFVNNQNHKYIDAFLKNHPAVDNIFMSSWDDVPFNDYDAVLLITFNEELVLQLLDAHYGQAFAAGAFRPVIYSLSRSVMAPVEHGRYIFPVHPRLQDYAYPLPGELYLSDEERAWADGWLREQGMLEHEQLFILLDSTSRGQKMLRLSVYFEFVAGLLKKKNARLLVFDEGGIGKPAFYTEWLGAENVKRIIFSQRLGLRQDLCLLGSGYTRMVFGPCTGLMHCASVIFNNYVANGLPPGEAPLLAVYTGEYIGSELNAWKWWGNAPLVDCLMMKQRPGDKELVLLADLGEDERYLNNSLPCSEYTALMLTAFVNARLQDHTYKYGEQLLNS